MIPHCVEPYSWPWWELRRGKASASAARKIITPSNGRYSAKQADNYINELIAAMYDPGYGCHEDYQTAEMKNGHLMEPEARNYYEAERDCEVQRIGIFVSDNGREVCSPDGVMPDQRRGLEIKCPKASTLVKWLRAGTLPVEHKPQLHFSLMVSGYEAWDFLAYAPGLPKLLIEVRPDEYTDKLREHMKTFWANFDTALAIVQAKMPPPPKPENVNFGAFGTVEISAHAESYF